MFDPRRLLGVYGDSGTVDLKNVKPSNEPLTVRVVANRPSHGDTSADASRAHRLATLRDAGRILVFEEGRLIEQGAPDDLLAQNGLYARLVRLQSQLSGSASVDFLLGRSSDAESGERPADCDTDASSYRPAGASEIAWLDPDDVEFRSAVDGGMEARLSGSAKWTRAEIVQAFPGSASGRFLSVRTTVSGEELGILSEPSQWSIECQRQFTAALDRRYVWPVITSVEKLELKNGYLQWFVDTDRGRFEFAMRWANQQAVVFGPSGKLLMDADGNRYRLLDVGELPPKMQSLVRKYVYW